MDYQQSLACLMAMADFERGSALRYASPDYNLPRMEAFLQRLGSPHLAVKTVHIAGTKGKGSTAAMVASVLRAAGQRVGLYTSPHLHTMRERIQLDGEPISERDFAGLLTTLQPEIDAFNAASPHGPLSTFEALTAMAFVHFAQARAGWQVIEVGLGGRLDATNVVRPVACGITSISRDHTRLLGDTVALIAGEKAGIIKDGAPVVSAPQRPEALAIIEETARRHSAPLTVVGRDITWSALGGRVDLSGQEFQVHTEARTYHLGIPLLGDYQIENAATAVGIIEALEGALGRQGQRIGVQAVQEGLRTVRWPARLQVLRRDPLVVADGAHNDYSAARLVQAVRRLFRRQRLFLIIGTSTDKDVGEIVKELAVLSPIVLACRSRHPRSAEPGVVAQAFERLGFPARTYASVAEAVDSALTQARRADLVLATGSLFVAAEAIERLCGIEPERYPPAQPLPLAVARSLSVLRRGTDEVPGRGESTAP